MKPTLVFCSVIFPGPQAEVSSLLLAESIRTHAGSMANEPIWFFTPDYGKPLTEPGQKVLRRLDVRVESFPIEKEKLQFFFMGQLAGLARAEEQACGKADILAWMDSNTILLHEPYEFLLPQGKTLAYRPVHHLLLGSHFDQPLDPFWSLVYQSCEVPAERVFSMRPVVEDLQMRPYFNAGFLVTRPEKNLLQQWYKTFLQLYQSPSIQSFYQMDDRYMIFLHQALLAGVVLSRCTPDELIELPDTYNYPVHLFEKDTTPFRPSGMDELVTFRHEGFDKEGSWKQGFPANETLKGWLEEKLSAIRHDQQ